MPEAQLDRFLLHVALDYPSDLEELDILRRDRADADRHAPMTVAVGTATVLAAREEVRQVHVADDVERYIVALVRATHGPGEWRAEWAQAVEVGTSPGAPSVFPRGPIVRGQPGRVVAADAARMRCV